MPIIECIPNVSEGRRTDVLEACAEAIRASGASLLDVKPDATHNRTVFTFAGEPALVEAGVLALFDAALAAIDLRQHTGEHPRLGAVDVVPFVPIEGATMADCVALARRSRAAVAARHDLPVYLYEEAASSPARRNLEDIRRGEFEGLRREDGAARLGAGLRPGHAAPSGRRHRDRRAHAAHRLQHQPGHRPAGRREEDRRRRPAQHRRPALRQGDGRRPRPTAASSRCR